MELPCDLGMVREVRGARERVRDDCILRIAHTQRQERERALERALERDLMTEI